jgi:HK97 family phage major capsid protein
MIQPTHSERDLFYRSDVNDSPETARKNRARYNLRKSLITPDPDSFEGKVNAHSTGDHKKTPLSILADKALGDTRDLSVTTSSAGGNLVQTSLEKVILPALYANCVCTRLGARIIDCKTGQFAQPTLSTGLSSITSSGENVVTTTDTSAIFSQIQLNAQRFNTEIKLSKQWLMQAVDRQADQFIASEAIRSIGALIDKLALTGSASGYATVTGLLNQAGLSTTTYGASLTWAMILQQIFNVETLNFPAGERGWATSPAVLKKIANSQKIASSNFPCFLYDQDSRTIAGFPVEATTALTGNQLIYGRWSEMAIVLFGQGVDIEFDQYSMASSFWTVLNLNLHANFAALRPGFCVSTDSASQ